MSENNRNPIEKCRKKLSQFTTMNVIDGQASLVIHASLIFYSLTIDNILNIMVLLILVAVSIATMTGENGILTRAQDAKNKTEQASDIEKIRLAISEAQIGKNGYQVLDPNNLQEAITSQFEGRDVVVSDNGDENFVINLKDADKFYEINRNKSINEVYSNTLLKYTEEIAFWKYKEEISNIIFSTEITKIPEDSVHWDLSSVKDNSVQGYLTLDNSGNGTFVLNIMANGKIKANPYCASLFEGFINLQTITGIENLDTSMTTNMYNMFRECKNLERLDLNSWNVENVKDMQNMFYNCANLKEIKISNFNTRSLEQSFRMLYNCQNLKKLDLSNFTTNNLTNAQWMFRDCKQLTELNISNASFSKVGNNNGILLNVPTEIQIILKNDEEKEFWRKLYPDINIS